MKSSLEHMGILVFAPLCLACAPARSPAQEPTSVLGQYGVDERGERFEMPGRLDEISGLATTPDGRLFAHDDERATVYEIDLETGAVGKRFSLGEIPLEADFEGLAIAGERFFMITSAGLLYEFREAGDRASVPYRLTDTGLGATCETEGLDYDTRDEVLLIACKVSTPDRGEIVVHRLPLDPSRARPASITIPRAALVAFDLDADFQPSSVVVSPTGTLVLVSAAPEAIIEVDRAGRVLAAVDFARRRHPQPEGLAFGPDRSLYVADEQNDAAAAVVTRYRPSPAHATSP